MPYRITVFADYAGGYHKTDYAFTEVDDELAAQFPGSNINYVAVPAFDVISAGFLIAHSALRQKVPGNEKLENRILFHNVAPRHDNANARKTNQGEGLAYTRLKNGVHVIGVNANGPFGGTFSYLLPFVDTIHEVDIGDTTSQFRSRDVFPAPAKQIIVDERTDILKRDITSLIPKVETEDITAIAENVTELRCNRVYIDGYGNIKLDLTKEKSLMAFQDGDFIEVTIGKKTIPAVVKYDGMFSVPDKGHNTAVVLSPGSSGWNIGNHVEFMQISQRSRDASLLFERVEETRHQRVTLRTVTNPAVTAEMQTRIS